MIKIKMDPLLQTAYSTLVVSSAALLLGAVLEKVFTRLPYHFALLQVALIGVAFAQLKDMFPVDPDAFIVFAPCIFSTQPTLLPRLKATFCL